RRDEEGHPILERQPTMSDNMYFFSRYQLGWMYWRYFMWNFSGKQNGKQGYNPWDKSKGHWITGINALDKGRTVDMTYATDEMKYDPARNAYFMLPFIFGLIGILWLFRKRPKDAFALLGLFLMTGIAIIIYSNQPPNEPRERDYVLIGSFAVFCIWIGMAVLAIYELLKTRVKLDGIVPGIIGTALVLIAPVLMGTQNWDDMSRSEHYGARDYASNFLNSVDKDAIIFTYGDNDTYPLWYAQEVEEIRTDVRVVNLSLIQVDWYIEQLRRKVNDSEAIKFTVSQAAIRGSKRSQFYPEDMVSRNPIMSKKRMALKDIVKFMGDDHPVGNANFRMESYVPTKKAYIALDSAKMVDNNIVPKYRASQVLPKMDFNLKSGRLLKGDLALLDIIASNVEDRPIYFAVTVRNENLQGLQNYLQMEGLALRLVPVKKGKNPEYGGYGTLGLGTLHTDKLYDNVMNKWQWGGFDKVDTHIDDKYGPSVQSMQIVFRRGIESLLAIDEKEKAVAMADKYFASFPNMNFAYDYSTFEFIEAYYKAGEPQKAKIHLDIYMTNAEQTLDFIDALDDNDVRASDTFQRDY
ncbi:MAG: DUF2723 domain-containing protein, partial [Saprospiraceae bacterium]